MPSKAPMACKATTSTPNTRARSIAYSMALVAQAEKSVATSIFFIFPVVIGVYLNKKMEEKKQSKSQQHRCRQSQDPCHPDRLQRRRIEILRAVAGNHRTRNTAG